MTLLEIDNIDRYIKLKERSGASQGQTFQELLFIVF